MPPGKHDVRMFEKASPTSCPGSTPINHRLKISTQMRPAQLASAQGITVIHFGPITGKDAAIPLAHQLLQHCDSTPGGNRKHTELRRHHRPQRAPLPAFLPRRLINIEITTLHVDRRFFHRRRDRFVTVCSI